MGKNPGMSRLLHPLLFALLAAALLAGCAAGSRATTPDETFYRYAGALRWGGIEQAWDFVDPAYRQASPPSELDLERYRQVEVKGFQVNRTSAGPDDTLVRDVEISLVNRHTQVERVVRHREQWRYDAEARSWWLVNGVPVITGD